MIFRLLNYNISYIKGYICVDLTAIMLNNKFCTVRLLHDHCLKKTKDDVTKIGD